MYSKSLLKLCGLLLFFIPLISFSSIEQENDYTEMSLQERCEMVLIPASALSMFVKYNNFEDLHEKITITDLGSDDREHPLDQALENEYLLENKIIFRLKRKKSRLHFEINKIASERPGIHMGSELLKLGVLVKVQDSDAEREYS